MPKSDIGDGDVTHYDNDGNDMQVQQDNGYEPSDQDHNFVGATTMDMNMMDPRDFMSQFVDEVRGYCTLGGGLHHMVHMKMTGGHVHACVHQLNQVWEDFNQQYQRIRDELDATAQEVDELIQGVCVAWSWFIDIGVRGK